MSKCEGSASQNWELARGMRPLPCCRRCHHRRPPGLKPGSAGSHSQLPSLIASSFAAACKEQQLRCAGPHKMLAALRRSAAIQACSLRLGGVKTLSAAAAQLAGTDAATAAAATAGGKAVPSVAGRPYSVAAGGSSAQPDSGQHFVIASSTPVTKRLWQR